jgi:hypothetical protein
LRIGAFVPAAPVVLAPMAGVPRSTTASTVGAAATAGVTAAAGAEAAGAAAWGAVFDTPGTVNLTASSAEAATNRLMLTRPALTLDMNFISIG